MCFIWLFIYVLLLLCILFCTHGYYMFTCHCCQRFIYVNKLSCTTDEGLTTENFGSYHYTILHQNRTLSSFLSIHYWCGKHIFISIEFLLISSKLDFLCRCNRHPTPKMPKSTLCLPPARWEPKALIPSVVAILPDFDGFLQITSKLDYLYRFSRNPTPTMSVLTLCLPPARWGPKAPDSECNGNIASFRRISSNLNKTRLSVQI